MKPLPERAAEAIFRAIDDAHHPVNIRLRTDDYLDLLRFEMQNRSLQMRPEISSLVDPVISSAEPKFMGYPLVLDESCDSHVETKAVDDMIYVYELAIDY